jgi:DNA repair protein RecO (recombination protein O)
MRHIKDEAIVIKRRNYGEADRLLTIFTKNNGKLTIKATGVRKIQSRRSSHIELLNYAQVALYKGRSIPVLTEVATVNNYPDIKGDLAKVGFAYHMCELIDGLCPENQENSAVFALLTDTLRRLSTDEESLVVIHEFEVELLSNLGYWNSDHANVDTERYIEDILERRLKSKHIFKRIS